MADPVTDIVDNIADTWSTIMDIDHMLNGKNSRNHHQEIIRAAQQDKLAREVQNAQGKRSPMRAVLMTLVNLVTK